MSKKKKKPLAIYNRYVFTNPTTNNHVAVNAENKDIRLFVYIGESSHRFTLTREEAAQLARNIHLLLDDTEEE